MKPRGDMDTPVDDTHAWIYFVCNEHDGLIKVGYTTNIRARLSTLRSSTRAPLTVLATSWGSVQRWRPLEKEIHKLLGDTRQRGEWFTPSPLLDRFIAACTNDEDIPNDGTLMSSVLGMLGLQFSLARFFRERDERAAALSTPFAVYWGEWADLLSGEPIAEGEAA